MKVVETKYFNGAQAKIERLGITSFGEVLGLLRATKLLLLEKKDSNGGAEVRARIDAAFARTSGWVKTTTGGVDWRKCVKTDGTQLCIGVEVQVSARSDLVVVDIMHLRDAIENGSIDVGVIVVPSDKTAYFLTDRCPSFRETISAIENRMRSPHLPLVILAVEHDGAGDALPKRKKA